MTFEKLRNRILQIFIGFLIIHMICIIVPYFRGEMYSQEFIAIISKLLAIFGVHFAIIIGGIFGLQDEAYKKVSKNLAQVSLLLIILWNILLVWRSISFIISQDDPVKDLSSYLETVSAASSFLIAGVLTYLFTKRESKK
jgi:hypothetical protein